MKSLLGSLSLIVGLGLLVLFSKLILQEDYNFWSILLPIALIHQGINGMIQGELEDFEEKIMARIDYLREEVETRVGDLDDNDLDLEE